MSVLKDFGRACVEESSEEGKIDGELGSMYEAGLMVGRSDR